MINFFRPLTRLTALLFLAANVGSLWAQDDIVKVNSEVVLVPTTVVDRDGRYVSSLTKENFRVAEDGIEQEISFFGAVDQKVTVMLLLDLSGSMNDYLQSLGNSAEAFIDQLRDEDDLIVAGYVDDSNIKILQEPVRKKDFRNRIRLAAMSGDAHTTTFDAVEKAMRYMERFKGRRAIVMFTDGEMFGRRASEKSTLRDAQEQESMIYTIRFGEYPTHQPGLRMEASQFPDERRIGEKELIKLKQRVRNYLEGLSLATGGRSFDLANIDSLEQTFRKVAEELGQQYLLGYSPAIASKDGERRKITVKVNIPNVAVRSRNEVVFKKKN
jgi:Ca-activated chloride channel family protein